MPDLRTFPMTDRRPFPGSVALPLPYLRKVYSLFTAGVGAAIVGALVALYSGSTVAVATRAGELILPPIVAFGVEHPIVSFLGYLGAFFAASSLRRTPGVNVLALLAYTFVTGLFVAPALFFSMVAATAGATLDASPVRDAFLLTGAAFTGLTGYVLVSRRDFSFLGASLSLGLFVLIGASLLSLLFGSSTLGLAVASVGVLLFGGYILYDTSRLLRDPEQDAVSAALRLFLDVVNLFLSLLRILSSSRSR